MQTTDSPFGSHASEAPARAARRKEGKLKAYVLAAGYATRLGAIARDRAKPLLDVGGRPALSYTLDRLLELEDLTEVVVITNSRFHGQFVEWASAHRASVPIRVLDDGSTTVDDRRGAIGDLAFGVDAVPPGAEDWLAVAGDNLIGFDLRHGQGVFRSQRVPLLMLRHVGPTDDGARYNEVIRNETGRVIRFVEKPADRVSRVIAIALYFFTPEVTELLSRYLDASDERDAPGHFISWLVQNAAVASTFLTGDWFDIGSPETLRDARRALRM